MCSRSSSCSLVISPLRAFSPAMLRWNSQRGDSCADSPRHTTSRLAVELNWAAAKSRRQFQSRSFSQPVEAREPCLDSVPTDAVLVHQPPLACTRGRATVGKPASSRHRQAEVVHRSPKGEGGRQQAKAVRVTTASLNVRLAHCRICTAEPSLIDEIMRSFVLGPGKFPGIRVGELIAPPVACHTRNAAFMCCEASVIRHANTLASPAMGAGGWTRTMPVNVRTPPMEGRGGSTFSCNSVTNDAPSPSSVI
jgi:hypothetical protein